MADDEIFNSVVHEFKNVTSKWSAIQQENISLKEQLDTANLKITELQKKLTSSLETQSRVIKQRDSLVEFIRAINNKYINGSSKSSPDSSSNKPLENEHESNTLTSFGEPTTTCNHAEEITDLVPFQNREFSNEISQYFSSFVYNEPVEDVPLSLPVMITLQNPANVADLSNVNEINNQVCDTPQQNTDQVYSYANGNPIDQISTYDSSFTVQQNANSSYRGNFDDDNDAQNMVAKFLSKISMSLEKSTNTIDVVRVSNKESFDEMLINFSNGDARISRLRIVTDDDSCRITRTTQEKNFFFGNPRKRKRSTPSRTSKRRKSSASVTYYESDSDKCHSDNVSDNSGDESVKKKCCICKAMLLRLNKHITFMHPDPFPIYLRCPFKEGRCNKHFLQMESLKEHMEKRHKSESENVRIEEFFPERKVWNCNFCGEFFIKDRSLKTHVKRCHTDQFKISTCRICSFTAYSEAELKKHKEEVHWKLKRDKNSNSAIASTSTPRFKIVSNTQAKDDDEYVITSVKEVSPSCSSTSSRRIPDGEESQMTPSKRSEFLDELPSLDGPYNLNKKRSFEPENGEFSFGNAQSDFSMPDLSGSGHDRLISSCREDILADLYALAPDVELGKGRDMPLLDFDVVSSPKPSIGVESEKRGDLKQENDVERVDNGCQIVGESSTQPETALSEGACDIENVPSPCDLPSEHVPVSVDRSEKSQDVVADLVNVSGKQSDIEDQNVVAEDIGQVDSAGSKADDEKYSTETTLSTGIAIGLDLAVPNVHPKDATMCSNVPANVEVDVLQENDVNDQSESENGSVAAPEVENVTIVVAADIGQVDGDESKADDEKYPTETTLSTGITVGLDLAVPNVHPKDATMRSDVPADVEVEVLQVNDVNDQNESENGSVTAPEVENVTIVVAEDIGQVDGDESKADDKKYSTETTLSTGITVGLDLAVPNVHPKDATMCSNVPANVEVDVLQANDVNDQNESENGSVTAPELENVTMAEVNSVEDDSDKSIKPSEAISDCDDLTADELSSNAINPHNETELEKLADTVCMSSEILGAEDHSDREMELPEISSLPAVSNTLERVEQRSLFSPLLNEEDSKTYSSSSDSESTSSSLQNSKKLSPSSTISETLSFWDQEVSSDSSNFDIVTKTADESNVSMVANSEIISQSAPVDEPTDIDSTYFGDYGLSNVFEISASSPLESVADGSTVSQVSSIDVLSSTSETPNRVEIPTSTVSNGSPCNVGESRSQDDVSDVGLNVVSSSVADNDIVLDQEQEEFRGFYMDMKLYDIEIRIPRLSFDDISRIQASLAAASKQNHLSFSSRYNLRRTTYFDNKNYTDIHFESEEDSDTDLHEDSLESISSEDEYFSRSKKKKTYNFRK